MSNRIVITEEEKQTIKRLYESAPPPDESVLVTNKNPYKHSEYKSACRLYSKDLVDGDMFYDISYFGFSKGDLGLRHLYEKMSSDICKDIVGKKIRLPKRDEVLEVGEDIIVGFDEFMTFGFELKNISSNKNYLWVFEDKRATIDGTSRSGGNAPGSLRKNMTSNAGFGNTRNEVELPEGFMNLVVSKILEIKKQTNNLKMDKSESTIVNIPDEYVEIRKIVRTKTDF